ncbi:MAG: hydroxylamine oxidase [Deltaproteobacteria bacterium]|nr:hydroxylamine oxidase [Deltaproteobacteria bacterium]
MKTGLFAVLIVLVSAPGILAATGRISEATQACLGCHAPALPGIVADWEAGRMSKITPTVARSMVSRKRRVSFKTVPDDLARVVVGCAECHTMNPDKHKDTFEHNGYQVHVVVTPQDCATCHPVEVEQYSKNIMSHAYGNLANNVVYHGLAKSVNGLQTFDGSKSSLKEPDARTEADSCNFCHGTVVTPKGTQTLKTEFGEMVFPVLSGWPNQGVGRINPDGSKGACTPCHTRHRFSIEMARKPYTCSQCHKGPDVPAYKVYAVSKHGNIFSTLSKDKGWNFDRVPWTVGKDFTAPTCATCHVSLVVSEDNVVVAERTHQMNDRLSWRIFGLIYAHAHPISPDTTIIRNKAGLPLPTELTGEPASRYLIDAGEQQKRREAMRGVCLACHSQGWVDGHFARFEHAIKTTNEMTLTATKVIISAWDKGAASGLPQGENIFDEAIEKKWVEQWLFYANSTRYAASMGGADYGVFANGRWHMSKNIQEMLDWMSFKLKE